ncbi:hypothetical protein RHMOL_Rhmol05G0247700 [Rhododendron molle]|uniref:Uncharacterized protein n=1 Tax=Rhododendron molle TaxID=49168 RepID=A0ACC0NV56_RHOML|nr:hypothetical protein RHMOL_Rhmol05G0247700 [Rhododendron molle]
MEFKPRIITIFLLFLFLLLLFAPACFLKGGSEVSDSGIYDIDYRGPETHSYRPPPNRSNIHEAAMRHRKTKALRAGNGATGNRIHG